MRIVLQRVREASVVVDRKVVSRISKGLCLLVGIEKGDTSADAAFLAKKSAELRVFPDEEGKMNLSVKDIGGEVLAVSQFTLAGSVRKGRRPSFDKAEYPEKANIIFNQFIDLMRSQEILVETGIFAALMEVHLVNDGPVTFILDSSGGK
ncbi:MAG: D-tyrosyl-tRNA(Tyr) deacylase [Candidatus Aminicenantes bacterium]|nr:D-tyrosyl-tRNA(Tyr) deacylase [Candidatus Aminicenantes bacterium]